MNANHGEDVGNTVTCTVEVNTSTEVLSHFKMVSQWKPISNCADENKHGFALVSPEGASVLCKCIRWGRSFSFLHACHFRCTRAFQFDDGDPGTVPQVLGKAIRGLPPAGRGLRPASS